MHDQDGLRAIIFLQSEVSARVGLGREDRVTESRDSQGRKTERRQSCYRMKGDVHYKEARTIGSVVVEFEIFAWSDSKCTVEDFAAGIQRTYPAYLRVCEWVEGNHR